MKKKSLIVLAMALCLAFAGCSSGTPSSASTQGSEPASSEMSGSQSVSSAVSGQNETQGQEATLFIGTDATADGAYSESFTEYKLPYEGDLTPELLIQGISDLTGWDLTLADSVTSGSGGMTVCFAKSSALFVGPPEPQKEEFFAFDAESLSKEILDSIQKTLQMNFVDPALGDPAQLDIYYCTEGNQPLELPDIGMSWPIDQPYSWNLGKSEDAGTMAQPQEDADIQFLMGKLSGRYGEDSALMFTEGDAETINGEVCRVFEVSRDTPEKLEALGFFAVGIDTRTLYEMDAISGEYAAYAEG